MIIVISTGHIQYKVNYLYVISIWNFFYNNNALLIIINTVVLSIKLKIFKIS